MENNEDKFATIMEQVGFGGRFQKIYNIVYVLGVTFFGAMTYMNLILALNVPDFWCNVPGIENTNFSIKEWRELTLPTETDNRGEIKYSTCQMYDANFSTITYLDFRNETSSQHSKIDCVHGYQYDKEWYDQTIVTQEDWVCEKDLYVANTFVASRIAEVAGTFVFGQLGDTVGRKIVYYVSIISVVIGRIVSIITTSSYIWFIISVIFTGIAINSLFQSPFIVAMEISREDQRTNIVMWQSFGWSVGTCLMPLIFWCVRDWKPFMWLTSVSAVLVFIFDKYMIESPRWLISRGRYKDALHQFRIIAKINGNNFLMSEKEIMELYSDIKQENIYGIMSLFSGWRIARTTIIMAFSWCVVAVSYFTLVLFSSRMGGNPFLNFLLQSLVEVPAYFVGKYLGDKIGRRFTNCLSYFSAAISCVFILIFAKDPAYESFVIGVATFIKFLNGITFFAVSLQALETYPTCLRQTGISLGAISGNAVGVLAPYVVYLGTTYDIRYPYIILVILFAMAGTTGLFLPETLYQKLPDTLEDAKTFGKDQKFWSIPKYIDSHALSKVDELEKVKLNQKEFSP